MGDKEHSPSFFCRAAGYQAAQKFHHLLLCICIQRCSGFVRNKQFRTACQSDGNSHTLPHTSAEMMRILFCPEFRIRNTHLSQKFHRTAPRFSPAHLLMSTDCLCNLPAHRDHRIQRRHGILKDHRNIPSSHRFQCTLCHIRNHTSIQSDRPGFRDGMGTVKSQDSPHQRGFAAAGFSHQGNCFPRVHRQADAPDSSYSASGSVKSQFKVVDFQNWFHRFSLFFNTPLCDIPEHAHAMMAQNSLWSYPPNL